MATSAKAIILIISNSQETIFHFVRDYETVKVEQEVPNEFLLVLHDGDLPQDLDDILGGDDNEGESGKSRKSAPREKGAYYKNIERKMLLKKKRVNVRDNFLLFLFSCFASPLGIFRTLYLAMGAL